MKEFKVKIKEILKNITKKQAAIIGTSALLLVAVIVTVVFVSTGNDMQIEQATIPTENAEPDSNETIIDESEESSDESFSQEEIAEDSTSNNEAIRPADPGNNSTTEGNTHAKPNVTGPTTGNTSGINVSSMTKDQVISVLNDATSKAVNSKAGYRWNRNSKYTAPLEYSYKAALDKLLSALGVDVQSVVGNFIGIGSSSAVVPKGSALGVGMTSNQALIKSVLTSNDVSSFSAANSNGINSIELSLGSCTDPKRGGNYPISKFTNDFVVEKDVADALNNQNDLPASLVSSQIILSNIKLNAQIDEKGNLMSMKINYDMVAALALKVSILSIKGDGKANTSISFTDFSY